MNDAIWERGETIDEAIVRRRKAIAAAVDEIRAQETTNGPITSDDVLGVKLWTKALGEQIAVAALAKSFLDRRDEDWTYVDPEDIKRLARAVLTK